MASATTAEEPSAVAGIEDLIRKMDYAPCGCPDCCTTCYGTPGAYDPEHIERLLQNGHTMDELMPNMAQHYSISGSYPVLMLRPRTDMESPGSQVPMLTIAGKCVHLGDEGCTLKREDMPIVCISSYCCSDVDGSPGAGKVQINKGHLRDLWTSHTGQKIMALFEEASARENPGVELGYDALRRQMTITHDDPMAYQQATGKFGGRENALRFAMKEEAHAQRTRQMYGDRGVRCQNCSNPARVACRNCGSLRFCSDVCASKCTLKNAPGHPHGCVRIDTEQAALVRKRAELT